MKTYKHTFRLRYLAVLLAMMMWAPDAVSQSERSERRGNSRQQPAAQRSEQRAAARSQARAASPSEGRTRPPQAPARVQTQPQRASTPVRQTAAQPPQRQQAQTAARPAAPAQTPRSARSAPSTLQAPSTPSTANRPQNAPSNTTPVRRTFTRVNRTVEIADRTPQNTTSPSTARTSVAAGRSASASNEMAIGTASRVSAVITPSASKAASGPVKTETPAAAKTVSRPVTRRITFSRSGDNDSQTASRAAEPSVKTAGTTATNKRTVTETKSVTPKAATTEKIDRTPSRSNRTLSAATFNVYGAASRRTTDAKAAESKTDRSSANTAVSAARSETVGKGAARADRSTAVTPSRMTVNDIKTEPVRVAPSRSRTDSAAQDLKRSRAVRIHSEADRPQRPSRASAWKSADVSVRSQAIDKSGAGRDRGLHGRSSRSESAGKIVINNDNRVIVQGRPTRYHHRPHIPRRLVRDTYYIRTDPLWVNYGSGFYFRWSSSSLGVVVSLPYYHTTTVHYGIPYYGFSYYYPNYHRKYVFVSVGGYWPYDYRYRRYYWYGCHPYYWYGSRVIYEPQQNVTYNTYNYYSTETTTDTSAGYGLSSSSQPYYTLGQPKDEIIDEPEFQTAADLSFDNAVALFEAGKYEQAADQFREAVTLSPDDIILPFTYSQALFAEGDYAHAATVLRAAMANIPDDELTIFYPRGLYESDELLTAQIESLKQAADSEPFASDYQLLLGYQYLGLGELDKALSPLTKAAADPANEQAAVKLIDLAAQLKAEAEAKDAQS